MDSRSRRSVLGGLAALGAASVFAPPITSEENAALPCAQTDDGHLANPDAFESFLDGLVTAQLEAHEIPGATVAVVDGDETFAKGYGFGDLESRTPVRGNETLFRIGSLSKLFTWTAVMQGVERGRLEPDVDVTRYLDEVEIPATYEQPITLDHLGTHTAGFEDRAHGTFVVDKTDLQPLEQSLVESQPARVRPPGQFTAYSNYGAALAGHIAATTAGTSFQRYVDEKIFEPLSMSRSTFTQPVPDDLRIDLATGYTATDGGYQDGDFEFVGMPPTGAMSTTATDMARFVRAHLQDGTVDTGQLLDSETITEMHRRRFANDDRVNGMAFGFYEMSRHGVRVIGHAGDTPTFHSLLFLLPDHDVGAFVAYNSPGGVDAREEFIDELVDRYFSIDEPPVAVPDSRPTRESDLVGTYRSLRRPYTTSEKFIGFGETVSVSIDERGRLVTTNAGETKRWVEEEPLFFREIRGPDQLAFRETDGAVTHLFLGSRPPSAYERLSILERPRVHGAIIASSVLTFVASLVGWSGAALRRRYRGAGRSRDDSLLRFARWTGGLAAACFLLFLVGFVAGLAVRPTEFLYGDRLLFRLLTIPSLLGAAASIVTAVLAGIAIRTRAWGPLLRISYMVVALAAIAFTALLWYWNLLWYQM
ncbi:penicillin-binding protein, beta-lactamase class C [Halovivax ruber XH-70]|uniref:Penicillin-binding protein, beta-lactamase class C n=1 Tax=Halovivax ruber (strain DSM 18193 / JCM 13892 / XH-70) TaxID=797302 RepID=L0IGB5_HALRX|nr:serine hydrolase [Halovivax ruber]AGB17027.1 penicillin-binding protein, beta-lactamase class C [Halovivax ruber XH-70]